MNKNSNSRNGLIHLYNPKKEGLGHYDVNYINARRKDEMIRNNLKQKHDERNIA